MDHGRHLERRHGCTRDQRGPGPMALPFDLPVATHWGSTCDRLDDRDVGRHGGASWNSRENVGPLGERGSRGMADRLGTSRSSSGGRHVLDGHRRGLWVSPRRTGAQPDPLATSKGRRLKATPAAPVGGAHQTRQRSMGASGAPVGDRGNRSTGTLGRVRGQAPDGPVRGTSAMSCSRVSTVAGLATCRSNPARDVRRKSSGRA